ncbi:DUF6907 domain-containing protein [Streptomyces sp. CBMA29]|uniref:DUF6907 domain-containing protein n=1 Tax=Streptomyces sp. CBMA29 TaxID=1896314 RepID=UPI001662092D|nr:hypothetical protein [Streptomyces sp. CBMA29]MBD0739426.1 hypothetical protein [Streptomyces sp. CBMA29]
MKTSGRGNDGRSSSGCDGEKPKWKIVTRAGFSVEGYLPAWAEDDPSQTDVPLELLSVRLADVTHWMEFEGQSARIRSALESDGERSGESQILWGVMECRLFAEEPEASAPVVNLAIVEDFWIDGLDPAGLAQIAAKLRGQADRLDHEIRPRLVAARTDWAV